MANAPNAGRWASRARYAVVTARRARNEHRTRRDRISGWLVAARVGATRRARRAALSCWSAWPRRSVHSARPHGACRTRGPCRSSWSRRSCSRRSLRESPCQLTDLGLQLLQAVGARSAPRGLLFGLGFLGLLFDFPFGLLFGLRFALGDLLLGLGLGLAFGNLFPGRAPLRCLLRYALLRGLLLGTLLRLQLFCCSSHVLLLLLIPRRELETLLKNSTRSELLLFSNVMA